MEDTCIIELYWNRDETAIEETDREYGRVLTGIAQAILHNQEDSEECVNDTYLRVWNTIPPTRPMRLLAFLGRITRNLAINRWNRNHAQKRGQPLPLQELGDCLPSDRSVEEEIDVKQLTGVIADWLRKLSQDDRVLFLQRYWYCVPVEKLATDRGLTPNKLAGRMFRLRQKLKGTLEQEEWL